MKRSSTAFLTCYAAICSYSLLASGIICTIESFDKPAVHAAAQSDPAKPVILKPLKAASKSQLAVDQLAALTPGCNVHDWGCVLNSGKGDVK